MLRKCYQRRLIPLAFIAVLLENELQYHGLAVRVNSGDDGAIYIVKKFGELMSSDDRAYMRTAGMTRPKTGVYSLISPDIQDRFSQSFRADDGSVPFFQFVKGRCHGNEIMLP